MTLEFDNLKPETLEALIADEGVPAALRNKISKLIERRASEPDADELSLAHADDSVFVRSCEARARRESRQ
jgi:hypothetical protein